MLKEKKFFRKCPKCLKELGYTNKKNKNYAEKYSIWCKECSTKECNKRPEIILKHKEWGKIQKERCKGRGNPFYGKHHTDETKRKIIENRDMSYTQTDSFKKKSARKGKKNGMYGKNFYDVWLNNYGKQEADERMRKLKEIRSKNSSGSKNSMYGKPSPHGSGGGWSGWYKEWYFRSLRELSYMINIIEKKNYQWENAENKKFSIKYIDYNKKERTYRADFFINNKILVEVKPVKLMKTPSNILKKTAAEVFCKNNNFEYQMVDIKIMDISSIISLFESEQIKFVKKYDERIRKIISKRMNNGN
jgi:hypothetical protein